MIYDEALLDLIEVVDGVLVDVVASLPDSPPTDDIGQGIQIKFSFL